MDSNTLFPIVQQLIGSRTWYDAKEVIKRHPRLLTDEADEFFSSLVVAAQANEEAREVLEENRVLLQRCREVGIEEAVKEKSFIPFPNHFSEEMETIWEYQKIDSLSSLNAAIDAWERILSNPAFTNSTIPFQLYSFDEAGRTYICLYEAKGQRSDLDRSIALLQEALKRAQAEQFTQFIGNKDHLGIALYLRYMITGREEDLNEAIKVLREAVEGTLANSIARPGYLSHLGVNLHQLYKCTGRDEDLNEAIEVHREAVKRTPAASPNRPLYLNNLGNSLFCHYFLTGGKEELNEAIKVLREAVEATPADSPNWPIYLNSLGCGLVYLYDRTGRGEDLNEALKAQREAVERVPADSLKRRPCLRGLGASLAKLYERTGRVDDLNEAITVHREAVELSPAASPEKLLSLGNLGSSLRRRYDRTGRDEDLNEAINAHREAVEGAPADAPDRPGTLNNLGGGLCLRYARTGREEDLNEGIKACQEAVEGTLANSPDRPRHVDSLASGLMLRYGRNGCDEDLNEAIKAYRKTVEGTSAESPERPVYLRNLGVSLQQLYDRTGHEKDLEAAKLAFRQSCEKGEGLVPQMILRSSKDWGNWALERRSWKEAVQAFTYGWQAIDLLLKTQLLRSGIEEWLTLAQELPTRLAYALTQTGALAEAATVLEGGRARLLSEALELNRQDLEQLAPLGYGDVYERYKQAAAQWQTSVRLAEYSEWKQTDSAAVRAAITSARAELGTVVETIRSIEGYGDFLRSPTFDEIRRSAQDGPLVYLLATPVGGLALIVQAVAEVSEQKSQAVVPVWLNEMDEPTVQLRIRGKGGATDLGGYLGAYARRAAAPLDPTALSNWLDAIDQITHWIWDVLIGPVVKMLGPIGKGQTKESVGAVFVPTGLLALLPLHAAWTEDPANRDGRCYALDLVTFSYTPNARSLATARARANIIPADRLLLLVEPEPVSANPLPSAKKEAQAILDFWPESSRWTRWHISANLEALITLLPECSVFHFAGHAFASWIAPRRGGLLLAWNRLFTVEQWQVLRLRLQLRLAVLSACETGLPGLHLPDEMVGLPSALVEAGAAGVIASLWPVSDASTAQLMARFYQLWREDELDPPVALAKAQLELRDSDDYNHPYYWAAFYYTGA